MQVSNIDIIKKAKELGIKVLMPIQLDKIRKSVNRSKKGPSIELIENRLLKYYKHLIE